MNKAPRIYTLLVGLALLAGGCKGGISVDIAGPTIASVPEFSEPVTSIGVATSGTDLRVNGVRYSTRSATVRLDGTIVTSASVQPGHYVHVGGRVQGPGLEGTAEIVDVDSHVIGPLERIDVVANELTVLGQAVGIGTNTRFGAGIDPLDLAGINVGAVLRISGYATADGGLAATRIDILPSSTVDQVIGRAANVDVATMRFRIGALDVDYSNARHIALPDGGPRDGEYLLARGTLAGGVLRADELTGVRDTTGRDVRERTYLEGLVTGVVDPRRFDIGAFRIARSSSTRFENGARTDLDVGVLVRIYGRVGTDGVTIEADEIEYLPLLERQP